MRIKKAVAWDATNISQKVKTMDFKEMNPLGIIGVIGAIILVVGVFLGWLTPDYSGAHTYSGWDIQSDVDSIKSGYGGYSLNYAFLPLVALICGIISIVLMIIPTIMNAEKFQTINNILGLVALILAIVVVICGLRFYLQSWTVLGHTYKLTEVYKVGIGFWLVLVGGIITLIGGIMPILKNKVL